MLFLVLLSFLSVNYSSAQNVTYDDLALKRCDTTSEWSVHGLWPEYSNSTWPQFCDPSRYKELTPDVLAPFRDLMDKYWYACEGDSFSFWQHEWNKHGTCQPLPVAVFFRRTIDLFLEAKQKCWYKCCENKKEECLIHINKQTYNWTGVC